MGRSLADGSPATRKPTHSMRAKLPLRPRGSRAIRSETVAWRACRPRWRSGAVSRPFAARSTRPPGTSTEFSKLKASARGPARPLATSWQDIPPPESMPAQSASAGLGRADSSWSTAPHSAVASSRPLSTSKRARSPKASRRFLENASRCRSVSTPVSKAFRIPAVAPTSTRPDGSCCARRSTRPARRASSWRARASGSPRQSDFVLRTSGRPSRFGTSVK
mmetsp:Transcript_120349/g.351604  ORF Transcript_120349/g.351604 Transcript_120349/m.351604 type:complete len:221 (+) Transcript_120349:763-1425(+)